MKLYSRAASSVAFGVLILAISGGAASAQDANAVAQRLKDTLSAQGADLKWTAATGSGGQVILDGVTYGVAGAPTPFAVGKVVLDGVTETNGGYSVANVTLPAINFTQEGITVTTTESTLTNMRIPAAGETDLLKNMLVYDSGKLDKIEVKAGEKQVALVENSKFAMTPPESGPITFTAAAEKFSADLSAIPDPQTQAVVAALGYQQITGNVQMAGSWNTTDGRMELSKYDIAVDDAGTIGFTVDVGGYTPQFLQALQDINKQMAANPGGDMAAQNAALTGLMQQLLFNGASIRFDDASLTGKALDFVAKQQGADAAKLKEQTKTVVPFLLASSPIKDEALKKQIADAVSTYIDNPKSLTIRAKPAQPQPFSIIAAQSQADPAALTSVLGVTVSAND